MQVTILKNLCGNDLPDNLIKKLGIKPEQHIKRLIVELESESGDKEWHIPNVSEKEQKEIEEILKKPECNTIAFEEVVEI